jgi:serine/threonine protein phosphatase 1
MNIIGDIAGQYDSLLALVKKLPDDEIVLVGDLVDRGPKSKQVIEWAMSTPNVRTILGNHEHMMLDFHGRAFEGQSRPIYDRGLWDGVNGGAQTLASYGDQNEYEKSVVPKEHLDWLASLPLYIETDDAFISHSSVLDSLPLEYACNTKEWVKVVDGILWNREKPTPRSDGKLQVFGHNSQFGLKKFFDRSSAEPFAICIDDSGKKRLTAYNTKTKEIIQQDYLK